MRFGYALSISWWVSGLVSGVDADAAATVEENGERIEVDVLVRESVRSKRRWWW